MTERKDRSKAIRLPALQHASLQAMGLSVPWIVSTDPGHVESANGDHSGRSDAAGTPVTHIQAGEGVEKKHTRSAPMGRTPLSETDSAFGSGGGVKPAPVITGVQSPEPAACASVPSADELLAREQKIRVMSLDDVSRAIESCEVCRDLCRNRKHPVPGQGITNPRLMIIGEAPGEMEDLKGLPFVGRSGELLDNMLVAIGLSRTDSVFVANTIKCRPPANRNPRPEEVSACKPYLQRQIELLEPQVILVVGLFASQTLLGSTEGVQALRQRDHFLEIGQRKIPVVVTFHPAYLLRRPEDKFMAWQDLKQVWSLLREPRTN